MDAHLDEIMERIFQHFHTLQLSWSHLSIHTVCKSQEQSIYLARRENKQIKKDISWVYLQNCRGFHFSYKVSL